MKKTIKKNNFQCLIRVFISFGTRIAKWIKTPNLVLVFEYLMSVAYKYFGCDCDYDYKRNSV